MKFAFVSHVLPPSESGQSVVIQRLLSGFPPEAYCLIGQGGADPGRTTTVPPLPARRFDIPAPYWAARGGRYPLTALAQRFTLPLAVRRRGRRIAAVLREQGCRAVVACTGGSDLT